MAYRPSANAPVEPPSSSGSVPFGVQLLAFLAGLVFLLLSGKSVMQDARLIDRLRHLDAYYEAVPATWLKVEVRRDTSGKSDYYPDVLFDANVHGQSVWGWRLSLEEAPGDSQQWAQRLAKYRVGDTVTAWVDRQDPKNSFIEKRNDGLQRVLSKALLGAAFGLFGATLVVLALYGWVRAGFGRKPSAAKRKRRGDRASSLIL
ncbi:MAG TPA: DUF3592 domain-containing protein [Fibrobacteria bacterium]|jgi:hypothetical protein|nr:DUF3592 domain-containing protein [Fibrobacteria bacterium]